MLYFSTALIGTAASMPVVVALLRRRAMFDMPNHRSSHTVPVPRGAGIACTFGIGAAAATLGFTDGWPVGLGFVLAGGLLIAGVGLADDLRPQRAVVRLAAQVLIGAVVGGLLLGPWGALLGLGLMTFSVNAVNFMDGINGISAATMSLWGAVLWWQANLAGELAPAFVGAVSVGCALAFLPFNSPRARIFLGDSGSYLYGALIAGGLLLAVPTDLPLGIVIAPLLIYVTDVLWTLLRRARRCESLTSAHRDHVYQLMANDRSLPHHLVTTVVALLSALLVLTWALLPTPPALAVSAALMVGYLSLPRWGHHHVDTRSTTQQQVP